MKTCFKCEEEKPLNHFYKHPRMADGRVNKCKECNKEDVKENRLANIEYYKEYDRNRPNEDERKKQRYRHFLKVKNSPEFKSKKRMYSRNYRKAHPLKPIAQNQWRRFLKNNPWLKKEECSKCGSNYRIEAHHEDYTKPLSVIWLCKSCHGARHREINEEIRNGVDWSARGF